MDDLRRDSDYFGPFLTVLKYFRFTGINIFDERVMFLKIKHFYLFMFSIYMLTTIGYWGFLVKAAGSGVDLLDVIIDLSFCLSATEGCLLYIHYLYSKKMIKSFVLNLGKEWYDDGNLSPETIALRREKMKALDRFNYVFFNGASIFVHIYLLIPITGIVIKKYIFKVDVDYVLPFRFLTPFNYEDNFALYLILYGVDYLMTLNIGYLVIGSLLLLAVCMNQLRILLDLLQNEFRDVLNAKDDFNKDEKIKQTVGKYVRLLSLISELSNAFGAIFAIHLVFLSAVICFFCVTAMINGRLEDLKNLIGSFITVITIYNCCYNGQRLSDSAVDVGTAIYDSEWYTLCHAHKKIVLLTILRSQRVTYVRSASCTYISLATFVKIMNTAWTLISLITGMYKEE